jgi:hypothetical protein
MSLVAGQSMIRVEDGTKGLVVVTEGDIPRIAYVDRGEQRFAAKGEKWEPVTPPPRKMRREEMLHIARFADSALRAAELHEPHKWWYVDQPTYDQDLVDLIVGYLEQRK